MLCKTDGDPVGAVRGCGRHRSGACGRVQRSVNLHALEAADLFDLVSCRCFDLWLRHYGIVSL